MLKLGTLHQFFICEVNWPGCDLVILCPLGEKKISLEVQGPPILGRRTSGRVALAEKNPAEKRGAKSTWSRCQLPFFLRAKHLNDI